MPIINFLRARHNAVLPRYASTGAAGMDVAAALHEPVTIWPGDREMIPIGWRMEIPEGFECQIRPRSGLASKHGITVVNSPGTIDADYRGEVCVMLINLGHEPYLVSPGDRIAQMVLAPVTQATLVEVDQLSNTDRGDNGFGSTGA
jgi:dUTP pyrophosphatase